MTSDYIFRGITQSNHKPSVAAYFEPRYNVSKDLQLYVGISGESISFPNRAAAEIDGFAGIRPTFGPLALDFGGWYYWYRGGRCFNSSLNPVFGADCLENAYLPVNVVKKDLSFWEVYAKGTYTVNDQVSFAGAAFSHRAWFSRRTRLNTSRPCCCQSSARSSRKRLLNALRVASGDPPGFPDENLKPKSPPYRGVKRAVTNCW